MECPAIEAKTSDRRFSKGFFVSVWLSRVTVRHLHCHFDGAYGRGVENFKEVKDLEEDSCAVFWENVDVLAKAVVVLG